MNGPCNKTILKKTALICLMSLTALDANAFIINVGSWDSSVTAAEQSAINYAIKEYESLFSNNITVNIDVHTSTTGLGSSNTNFLSISNYNNLVNAIKKADSSVVLPSSSAVSGQSFVISTAEYKALGLGTYSSLDGSIYFNSTLNYATDPNNRQVSGAYDLIGVAEHEISEVLGRLPGMDAPGFPYLTPLDLYRYAGQAVFSPTATTGAYFSVDGGKTNLQGFNSTAGGDLQDWNGSNPSDPFNAFTGSGQGHSISTIDITTMHALGYTLTTVPLPASIWLFASACLGMGVFNRRRDTFR